MRKFYDTLTKIMSWLSPVSFLAVLMLSQHVHSFFGVALIIFLTLKLMLDICAHQLFFHYPKQLLFGGTIEKDTLGFMEELGVESVEGYANEKEDGNLAVSFAELSRVIMCCFYITLCVIPILAVFTYTDGFVWVTVLFMVSVCQILPCKYYYERFCIKSK